MVGKEFAHEGDIRPSGKLETLGAVVDAKFAGEGAGKGLYPRPARVDERPIHIK